MASIGHIAVGLAAGRGLAGQRDRLVRGMLWFTAISCAADLDLALLLAGIPSNTVWGHRGFTHSVVFAAGAALASAWVGRRWDRPAGPWAVMGFAVYVSHMVLDCLNVGTVGVPWLWPLSSTYYSIPWSPIPAVIRAEDFLTRAAVPVVAAEVLLFAPLWIYALVVPWSGAGRSRRPLWRARSRRIQGAVE